jgi:hypothetical protein
MHTLILAHVHGQNKLSGLFQPYGPTYTEKERAQLL